MTKPAYMIINIDVRDPDKLLEYADGAMPVLAEYGAELLGATGDYDVEDGDWPRGRTAVIKFPSLEVAKTFWTSEAYKPWKEFRESFSEQDAILVEGMFDEEPGAPADEGTPCYMIGASTAHNDDWVAEYMEKVPPVSSKYGSVPLAAGPNFEVLDGTWPGTSMVMLKFPSKQAFKDFWWGDEYKAMKELREANCDGAHISFEGGFGQP